MRTLALIVAFVLACSGPALAADFKSAAADVDAALDEMRQARDFSGALIVEVGDRRLLAKGYGFADREAEIPFTINTIAQVGSITKHFTAMTALLLADEGKLHLYRPISLYLPEAPQPGASVTLDQLMTHTAGLPEYCGEDDFIPLSRDELINECLSRPLLFEPGSRSEYSNGGFSIVAAIIERVTGRKLEDVMEERLFKPNGLDRTGYLFPNEKGLAFAYGYEAGARQEVISRRIAALGDDWWALKGNGGLQASARDMARWRRVLRGAGNIRLQTIGAATSPRHASEPRIYAAYGLNVVFDDDGETLQVSHSGSDGVFFSYFWMSPRDDSFFYLVGNAGEEVTRDAAREVRRILYEAGGGSPHF